jgi:hypothetical protein
MLSSLCLRILRIRTYCKEIFLNMLYAKILFSIWQLLTILFLIILCYVRYRVGVLFMILNLS